MFQPFCKCLLLSFLISMLFFGCNTDGSTNQNELNSATTGSGFVLYNYSVANYSKTLRIFYYIPQNATSSTPILFAFHGVNRNADAYRNALINKSNALNFIIIAPEFSDQNFPTGDGYALGNVYIDGDNPTVNSLNPESNWSFSIVEPMFDFFKKQLKNSSTSYTIFGHSAGAQFAHRFLMFKPNNRASQIVISAAGWYTFPDKTVPFPYGTKNSILENKSTEIFFAKNVFVQVGELDNNPNDSNLRHNFFADAQGLQRVERATNFYNFCKQQAEIANFDFNWTFHIQNNASHNFITASENAAELLFN